MTRPNPLREEPPRLDPMLATSGRLPSAADDEQFGYEVKWDGIRAVGYLNGGRLRLLSRSGRDVTSAFPELAPPTVLDSHTIVLDGEIVAFDEAGKPSFGELQPRIHVRDNHVRDKAEMPRQSASSSVIGYVVFDLLHLDGHDLTGLGYRERRELLGSLGIGSATDNAWTCPDYQVGNGADLFEAASRHGLEGVMAKRLDSRYLPGRRSANWIKVKHMHTQEVVIGGWTPGEGRRDTTLGALLLGVPGPEGLEYVGHVGTGFTDRALTDLRARLDRIGAGDSPFAEGMPEAAAAAARWVRPVIVGEVVHTGRTPGGLLRMASWRGLRPDKKPEQVRAEED